MNYPLLTDYIDSIRFAEDNFATLTNLRPVYGKDDNLIYYTEGNSVIFKMEDVVHEKVYCVKCFLSEQLGRKEWYDVICKSGLFFSKKSLFLENELFVDTNMSNTEEFPVFIYPYIENACLADYIHANIENKQALIQLTTQFSQILKWSRDNHFVWNKLDISKMVVNTKGNFEFVDLDDILLKTSEDTEIYLSDEVSIVMLLLSLKAISIMPEFFDSQKIKSHLLFAIQDGEHIVKSEAFQKLIQIDDKEINSLIGYLLLCLNSNFVTQMDSKIFSLKPIFESEIDELLYYAKNGDDNKQVELARFYYKQKSYAEAFKWYEAAAKQGNPDGINGVGCCYKGGFSVEKNDKYAVQLFSKAADKGSERAQYNLAMAYYSGTGIEMDCEKAFSLFKKLAEEGESHSQYMVGKYLMSNHGGTISWHIVSKRNTKEAFKWFEKSAIQGNPSAQQQLGMFYESGTNPCIRNIEKALDWYQKSADQGNIEAIFALGRLYTNGIDEKNRDIAKAFHYFLKAAESNHPEAQYRVGVALYYGKGIEIDKESAVLWLEKSASQRNESARNLLNQLKSKCAEVDSDNTAATQGEMANAKMDSYGVLYSADGKKLLHYGIDDVTNDMNFGSIKQQSLKKYSVPEGVTIICDDAFSDCESLESITLPPSVKLIGSGAFLNCVNLESIIIPEGVKSIESYTFKYCFEGDLRYKDFVELQELKNNPISLNKTVIEKKTRKGIVQLQSEMPIWIKPKSNGNAYLHNALKRTKYILERWTSLHPNSFPPIVIHISCFGYNGAEDSDVIQLANEIKSLYTKDGNVIFANLIFSKNNDNRSVCFPNTLLEMGKSVFGEMYFLMSSQLPLSFNQMVEEYRLNVDRETFPTAVAFNTSIEDIPKMIQGLIYR